MIVAPAQPITMTPEQYIILYEKYLSGACTTEEEELLMQYHDNFKMQNVDGSKLPEADKKLRSIIYNRISKTISYRKPKVIKMYLWWAAAAVIFLISVSSLFFNSHQPESSVKNQLENAKGTTIKPGKNAAVLTLANGTNIVLDNATNGVLAKSGNTSIKKLKNGLLAYAPNNANNQATNEALNTVTIPRGGQYTIMLPDGTNVWLNSESSLTFPVAFKGSTRKVTLQGEAYFEVTKNKEIPFVVHTDNTDIKVLGTHFNVHAYKDDNIVKTTLLEGSVRLSSAAASTLLTPGEQGVTDVINGHITQKKVNLNQVMAWKAGYFIFRDDDIRDIMKQISRWYDVEIVYEGHTPNVKFGGTYAKSKDINELLKGLEYTGLVHFKIEGRRIIVMA
ncbi:MAG: FecR domain-containing protein [Mucilaginibacter sp.]|uniref:FecR family protein n=1 Tax=Mucilaginibacter sp. TaxID=1882438 RepID=UPI0031AF5F41